MDVAIPSILWLLPLALLPVLLHLCWRRRRQQIPFSTLLFLGEGEKHLAIHHHLIEWLRLLLRCMAIAALITALSRPRFVTLRFFNSAKTTSVIIIDDTLSMQRMDSTSHSAFHSACTQAESLIGTLSKHDAVAILPLSGQPPLHFVTPQKACSYLHRLHQTAAAGNWSSIFQQAIRMQKECDGVNQEIHILSDFQSSVLPERPLFTQDENSRAIRIYLYPQPGKNTDLSVSATALPERLPPHRKVTLSYTVASRGWSNPRSTRITLSVNGRKLQETQAVIPPGGATTGAFTYQPEHNGRQEAAIAITDPDIPYDNSAPVAFSVEPLPKILLIEDDASVFSPFFYLQKALSPFPEKASASIEKAPPTAAIPERLSGAALVCYAPGRSADEGLAKRLCDYIWQGGSLLLFPADNNRFTSLLSHITDGALAVEFKPSRHSLQGIVFSSPLEHLNALQLSLIHWRHFTPIHLPVQAEILARVSDQAALAGITYGRGRLYLSAVGLRRKDSNWPELKSFPIAIPSIIGTMFPMSAPVVHAVCGTTNDSFHHETLFCPGIRSISSPATPSHSMTVVFTHSSKHLELQCAQPQDLYRLFSSRASIIAPDTDITRRIQALRQGMDCTALSLLAAFGCAMIEFALGMELGRICWTGRKGGGI